MRKYKARKIRLIQGGQRHLREEIKQRYDRYRELVEQSNEGIWLCEAEEPIDTRLPPDQQVMLMLEKGFMAECNDAMARMYGYSERTQLLGARLKQLMIPDNESNLQFLRAFVENGYRLCDVDSVETDRHGQVLHFRNNLIGVVRDHMLICAWGMQKDITQEIEGRERLRQSEERLRMASEAGGVGLWEWNILTQKFFWSDRTKQIYGLPPAVDVTLETFLDAVHPEDRERMSRLMVEASRANKRVTIAIENRVLAHGIVRWVQAFGETVCDAFGQVVQMRGTAIDITEAKLAEQNAIELQSVGTQLSQVMTLQDLVQVILSFAREKLQASAVTVHRKREKTAELELLVADGHSESTARTLQIVSQASLSGRALFGPSRSSSCAVPLILNQKVLGVIGLEFEQPQSFDKYFQRFILTFADQCAQSFERARLYEIERGARKEAEAANQAKSKYLASLSHEIRTPLGAMIGFAELLTEDGISSEERDDCLDRILRNGHMLADMINDILDLSKIESERLEVEQIDFELIPAVQEVMSLLQLKAQEKNLRLVLTTIGTLPHRIHSDPTRLKQILINLLSNAIKFTDQGRVEIRVAKESGDGSAPRLRFTIVDTGMGIPAAQQERIFEPFMQADSSTTRKFGGTGLGLAVARGLAQALGGDLSLLKSAAGEGSTFSFTIETGSIAPAAPETESPAPRKGASQLELSGLRILVVDDNPDNRTYIGSFLASAGAAIETAANGLQAIDLTHQKDFDIVLMDIQMPELDGLGAMRYLREKAYARPVLALTAHAMSGDRENSLKAGFQDHLVKPIDRVSLIQAIQRHARTKGSGRSGFGDPLPIK